jgi:N-acetylmuramoyl-L-alanine amidase
MFRRVSPAKALVVVAAVACLLALISAAAVAETSPSTDTTTSTDTTSSTDVTSTTDLTSTTDTVPDETTSTTTSPPTTDVQIPVPVQTPTFADVGSSSPAFQAVGFLSAAGIISGYKDGNFGPSDTLKRGQATKMLVLWQGVPLNSNAPSFPDLDDVYRSYVETASAAGWITGYADGRFKPYSTLSRQQLAIIMVRAMGWEDVAQGLSGAQVDATLSAFVDKAKISEVARPYVAVAASEGLFGGDATGNLKPKDGITRAQFCLVVFRAEVSKRAVIKALRSSCDSPDRTRIVLDLSKAPGSVTASASSDGTLTIDYTDGMQPGQFSQTITGSTQITSVAARQFSYVPRTVRITLDLGRYRTFRVMSLAPSEGKGFRIAVDVFGRTDGPLTDGPPLVFIDPGHGGSDPGATGVSGTKEKDINLAISLLVADNLRKAGLQVMMSRTDDSFPALHDRPLMANAAHANLFVAIHNNAMGAASDADVSGTETYYFGSASAFSPDGKLLAIAIQADLVAAIGSVDRGVKTAGFVVLAETDMTAALVECGFLTNPDEEAKLVTPAYQKTAAQGIAKGILDYLGWSTTIYSSEL